MKNIKALLIEKVKLEGISVAKIARETGISQDRLYQWVRGRGAPKAEDTMILAAYFGISSEAPAVTGQYTPLMDALTWALTRMQIVESTRIDARHYLGRMQRAADELGLSMRPLREIRKKDLRAILRSFEQAYQFNKARGYLMSMVEELCQEEALEANPVRDIRRMKATKRIRGQVLKPSFCFIIS